MNMGDRCYSTVTCAKRDQEHFEALGYLVQGDGEALIDGELQPIPGAVSMVDEQSNYGHSEELRDLAEEKHLPFLVQSGPGDSYGDYVGASDGKTFAEHECLHDSSYPAVRVGPDGSDPQELHAAFHYWAIYQSAVSTIAERAKEEAHA
jgi:hypothetical protein